MLLRVMNVNYTGLPQTSFQLAPGWERYIPYTILYQARRLKKSLDHHLTSYSSKPPHSMPVIFQLAQASE